MTKSTRNIFNGVVTGILLTCAVASAKAIVDVESIKVEVRELRSNIKDDLQDIKESVRDNRNDTKSLMKFLMESRNGFLQ